MDSTTTFVNAIESWLYDTGSVTRRLTIATVTKTCEMEPDANLAEMTHMIDNIMRENPDVNLMMFGEMILGHYMPAEASCYHQKIADTIPGKATHILGELAQKHGIYLCFGLSERVVAPSATPHFYNTQVLLNPEGEVQTCHRKWNLKSGEAHAGFQPGEHPVTITDILRVKTGIIICADAAHPQTILRLLREKVELILFSLADDADADWFVAKANARLYDAWVVSANRFGKEQHYWNGHTVISDPLGHLRVTSVDKAGQWIYELGFPKKNVLKQLLRSLWVKPSLLFHVLTHLKVLKSYY